MGNVEPVVEFCDGCLFANGVEKAGTLQVRATAVVPNSGMAFEFVSDNGQETHTVSTPASYSFDTTEVSATGRDIIRRVRECKKPIQETRDRLGGLLGTKTVQACGAFPGQNPKKPVIKKSSDAWMYMDY